MIPMQRGASFKQTGLALGALPALGTVLSTPASRFARPFDPSLLGDEAEAERTVAAVATLA